MIWFLAQNNKKTPLALPRHISSNQSQTREQQFLDAFTFICRTKDTQHNLANQTSLFSSTENYILLFSFSFVVGSLLTVESTN